MLNAKIYGLNFLFETSLLFFSVIYRHPRQKLSMKLEFQKQLKSNLEMLEDKNIRYYRSGDFNLNLLKYCTDDNVKFYVDDLHGVGCQFLIDKPTRIWDGKCSLVDHILTMICKTQSLLVFYLRTHPIIYQLF